MRVAQVVVTDRFAGTERYVATLAVELAGRGVDVTVLGGREATMRALLAPAGVPHRPAPDTFAAVVALRAGAPYDVVHAHLTKGELAAALAFPRRSSTAVVATRHIAARRGKTRQGAAAAHVVRRRLDGQVAPSRYVADAVDGPSTLVPTGVAPAPLATGRGPVVLLAQRLDPEKDTATALRAWAAAGLASQGWELQVAGTGEQAEQLQRLAGELQVGASVHWLGQVDDVAARMARASILLATAPAEPFGLTVVEAMAQGLPVVATAAAGHLETVGALPGARLFAPGDHRGAAAHLDDLAGDEAQRRAYGAGLQACQRDRFGLERFTTGILDFYQQVLGRRPAAPAPLR